MVDGLDELDGDGLDDLDGDGLDDRDGGSELGGDCVRSTTSGERGGIFCLLVLSGWYLFVHSEFAKSRDSV